MVKRFIERILEKIQNVRMNDSSFCGTYEDLYLRIYGGELYVEDYSYRHIAGLKYDMRISYWI